MSFHIVALLNKVGTLIWSVKTTFTKNIKNTDLLHTR